MSSNLKIRLIENPIDKWELRLINNLFQGIKLYIFFLSVYNKIS